MTMGAVIMLQSRLNLAVADDAEYLDRRYFFVGLASFACNFWNLHAELIDALSVRAFRAVVPFR